MKAVNDSFGRINIYNKQGLLKYTVDKDETGLIADLANQLLNYSNIVDSLEEIIIDYFEIGRDTYAYNLTRDKSAFAIGTISIDDFEEFDEEVSNDLANYIRKGLE